MPSPDPRAELTAAIQRRTTALLYQNVWTGQLVSAAVGILLVISAGGARPVLSRLWLALALIQAALRILLSRRYEASSHSPRSEARWRRRALLSIAVSGLLWAAGALLFMWGMPLATQSFTAFLIAGMVAGAVPVLSAVPSAFRAYAIPMVGAVFVASLAQARDGMGWGIALAATAFLPAVLKSASRFSAMLEDSIRMGLEQAAMARELASARDAALESSRAKSAFLDTVSHELRTPMNGVIGMAGLLIDSPLGAEQRQSVVMLKDSAEDLLGIVNDILDFTAAEAGAIELEELSFDLRGMVGEVAELLGAQALEKGLGFNFAVDPFLPYGVRGDPGRLRQVLLNLGGNAVKFTASGAVRLSVAVRDSREGRVRVRFELQDTGIGIPEDQLPWIYEPFHQADSGMSRRHGGTGLGLSISKRLVDLMGGRLEALSQPGQGSTFGFELEFPMAELPAAEAPDPAPALRHLRILVVEDNAVNQRVVGRMLEKLGHRADMAGNGLEALEALRTMPYDAVLMDCQMPEMDGLEATRRIRSGAGVRDPRIPVIALTANASPEDRARCLEAGMDEHLAKPVQLAALAKLLGCVLGPPGA